MFCSELQISLLILSGVRLKYCLFLGGFHRQLHADDALPSGMVMSIRQGWEAGGWLWCWGTDVCSLAGKEMALMSEDVFLLHPGSIIETYSASSTNKENED